MTRSAGEGISVERVGDAVQEALDKRDIDRGEDHPHLQLARLVAQAVKRGDLTQERPLREAASGAADRPSRSADERRDAKNIFFFGLLP